MYRLHRKWLEREDRENRRWAVMYTMYANAHRDEKRKPFPFELDDFFHSSLESSNGHHRENDIPDLPIWLLTPEQAEARNNQNCAMAGAVKYAYQNRR